MDARVFIDDRKLGKREDELPAVFEVAAHSLHDAMPKVPWHHEVVIGMLHIRLYLRKNRNFCPRREAPEFIFVHFCNAGNIFCGQILLAVQCIDVPLIVLLAVKARPGWR